jgi:hypothetical protein
LILVKKCGKKAPAPLAGAVVALDCYFNQKKVFAMSMMIAIANKPITIIAKPLVAASSWSFRLPRCGGSGYSIPLRFMVMRFFWFAVSECIQS